MPGSVARDSTSVFQRRILGERLFHLTPNHRRKSRREGPRRCASMVNANSGPGRGRPCARIRRGKKRANLERVGMQATEISPDDTVHPPHQRGPAQCFNAFHLANDGCRGGAPSTRGCARMGADGSAQPPAAQTMTASRQADAAHLPQRCLPRFRAIRAIPHRRVARRRLPRCTLVSAPLMVQDDCCAAGSRPRFVQAPPLNSSSQLLLFSPLP
jgi:hypothetical protein